MSIEDKLAIQEAIARYSYAYDSKDAEAFAELFVDDGIFEVIVPGESSPTVRLSSRAAIRAWAAQRHELSTASQARHYQSGVLFDELTTETATSRTMLLLTRQSAPNAPPSCISRACITTSGARPERGGVSCTEPHVSIEIRALQSTGRNRPEAAASRGLERPMHR